MTNLSWIAQSHDLALEHPFDAVDLYVAMNVSRGDREVAVTLCKLSHATGLTLAELERTIKVLVNNY